MSALLAAVLWFGLLTQWVPARWALSAFELALFALAATAIVTRRGAIAIHPAGALLAAAAGWGLLQLILHQSVYAFRTWEAVLGWITNLAAFSVALALLGDPGRRQRFLIALEVAALLLAVVSTFALFTSPGHVLWWFDIGLAVPAVGPFVYRNQYAAFVEAVLPMALVAAIGDRRRWPAHAGVAAVLFATVIAAGSRAGAMLSLAEIFIVPLTAFARGWIRGRTLARIALSVLLAAAAFTAVVGWEALWARLQEPNPYSLRADLLRSSIEMVRGRPLAGFGLGTWSTAYPGFAHFDDGTFVNQAHNDWIQWAAEGGLPFVAMLAGVVVLSLRPAARSVWGLGLVAVFLHAFVDYPFQQRPQLAAFFCALLGAITAAGTKSAGRPSGTAPDLLAGLLGATRMSAR